MDGWPLNLMVAMIHHHVQQSSSAEFHGHGVQHIQDQVSFLLCTDKKRIGWYLYEEEADYDTGKKIFALVTAGKFEAPHEVMAGLLAGKDISEIAEKVIQL